MTRLDELLQRFPEHLSVEQLAEVLGVAKPTAYRWLQQGDVPGYKVGRAWVILKEEVRDYLIANRNMPYTAPDLVVTAVAPTLTEYGLPGLHGGMAVSADDVHVVVREEQEPESEGEDDAGVGGAVPAGAPPGT